MNEIDLMQDFISKDFLKNLEEQEKNLKNKQKILELEKEEDQEECSEDLECLMCSS
jgi:hypothetical protein